jgi:hypothetical protein
MRKYAWLGLSLALILPQLLWAGDSAPETFTITASIRDIPQTQPSTVQVTVPPTACTTAGQPSTGAVTQQAESDPNPLSPIGAATPLYGTGTLSDANQARELLAALGVPINKPVLINIVWWVDPKAALAEYSQWYLYNPCAPLGYWMPNGPAITDFTLPGVKDFYFLYVHFYKDLGFSKAADIPPGADVFTYTVTITKQPSQFRQDLQTLAGLVNFPLPITLSSFARSTLLSTQHSPGYYAFQEIKSQLDTSSIVVSVAAASNSGDALNSPAASADQEQAPQTPTPKIKSGLSTSSIVVGTSGASKSGRPPTTPAATSANQGQAAASADQGQAPQKLTPNTYANQPPSYVGLGFAMPITSYKDVTYVPTSGTVGPTTVTRQNLYATLDFYFPPAVPDQQWLTLRWIPHPFVGLPLTGKVFEHPMAGIALGFGWLEAYAGEIYDTENVGPGGRESHKWERCFGIKLSVTAVAQLLKKGS